MSINMKKQKSYMVTEMFINNRETVASQTSF